MSHILPSEYARSRYHRNMAAHLCAGMGTARLAYGFLAFLGAAVVGEEQAEKKGGQASSTEES